VNRKYVLAILLLVAFSMVATLGLTFNEDVSVQSEVYQVSDSGATGTINKVKVKPLGSLNKVKIEITLDSQTVAYDLDISLMGSDLDLTGATITGSAGTAGAHVLSSGENILYFTAIPAGSSWSVTIDATGGYSGTNTVWEDITELLVTIADS